MSYVILTQHQRLEGSTLPPWHGQNGGNGHGRDRAKEFEGQIAAMAILVLALLLARRSKWLKNHRPSVQGHPWSRQYL